MWAHLSLLGALEASRGHTKQTIGETKAGYGVGAGWKHPTCPEVINHDGITLRHPENTDWGSYGPLPASRGQTKQTMVGLKAVHVILEQFRRVQRA